MSLANIINNLPNANTAAVVTLAAEDTVYHHVHKVVWSYSSIPGGGRLHIKDGSTVLVDVDITVAGKDELTFTPEIRSKDPNTAMEIKLYAGGLLVTGKLNVVYFSGTS